MFLEVNRRPGADPLPVQIASHGDCRPMGDDHRGRNGVGVRGDPTSRRYENQGELTLVARVRVQLDHAARHCYLSLLGQRQLDEVPESVEQPALEDVQPIHVSSFYERCMLALLV